MPFYSYMWNEKSSPMGSFFVLIPIMVLLRHMQCLPKVILECSRRITVNLRPPLAGRIFDKLNTGFVTILVQMHAHRTFSIGEQLLLCSFAHIVDLKIHPDCCFDNRCEKGRTRCRSQQLSSGASNSLDREGHDCIP